LPHDAYVWQRRWTPAVSAAIAAASPNIRQWRVLAAEVSAAGTLVEVPPPAEPLQSSRQRVVMVVRIDGQIQQWNEESIAIRALQLVHLWRRSGTPVLGLEIDHDAATSRLARYATFLDRFQPARRQGLILSATALPSWLESDRIGDVLARVDEAVLQVHSVANPRTGLFDSQQASDWIRRWSRISPHPFVVALPTYGSRVTWNDAGKLAGVESEVARYGHLRNGRELFVRPLTVASFLDDLRRHANPQVSGIAWFRLPTSDDRRAWSMETWRAVMTGQSRVPLIRVDVLESDVPGTLNVYVSNDGVLDDVFPAALTIDSDRACESADAVIPYAISRRRGDLTMLLTEPRLLPAGSRHLAGWVRCAAAGGKVYARF
jgi:hypothetical protein